jgi:hypothetical protein
VGCVRHKELNNDCIDGAPLPKSDEIRAPASVPNKKDSQWLSVVGKGECG